LRVWRGLPAEQGHFCGTGFLVTPTLALTAKHVAQEEGAGELYLHLTTMGGFFARVEQVWLHPDAHADVALLRIGEQALVDSSLLVPFGDPLPVAVGDELEVLGFADAHSAAESRTVRVAGLEGAAHAPILQGAHPRGLSGAPVLSPDGILRGIVSARDMDKARGYVVPFSSFRSFLRENGIRATTAAPTPPAEYPAKEEDQARLSRARELLLKWRTLHTGEVERLSEAAEQAREWQLRPPSRMTQVIRELLGTAIAIANSMTELPVAELEFARSYGLQVHSAVFGGLALYIVNTTYRTYGDLTDAQCAEMERIAGEGFVPGSYAYEMIARLLESAVALVDFGPNALPLGFLEAAPLELTNFSGSAPLALVKVRETASLRLLALEDEPRELGTLAARRNGLKPEAARIMPDGTLDAIATDLEHRYRWTSSASRPSAQYPHRTALFATYPSGWSSPALVLADGSLTVIHRDSRSTVLTPATTEPCAAAAVWQDSLDPSRVRLVRLTTVGVVSSVPVAANWDEVAVDFRHHLALAADGEDWLSISSLDSEIHVSSLEGFPCVHVTVRQPLGTVLLFLDPVSLAAIRPPRVIRETLYAPFIGADRWLFAAHATAQPGAPVMSAWDLKGPADAAPVRLSNDTAVRAEIYASFVVPEAEGAFTAYFTMLLFADGLEYRLCRLRWPSRQIETLECNSDLTFVPVMRD
jgi:hypothetical protein